MEPRIALPLPRDDAREIAAEYAHLRGQGPAVAVSTPAGDPAWLVSRYDVARAVSLDPRFGRSHPAPARASRISDSAVLGGPVGDASTEHEDHARLRRLLTPTFSARRMRALGEHVEALVGEAIDSLVASRSANDAPADLHAHLAQPVPLQVICELLGVPYGDRDHFCALTERACALTGDDPVVAMRELTAYAASLAADRRRRPAADLITDLVAATEDEPGLTDHAVAAHVAGVLFAGHETTVKRIDLGVVLLDREAGTRRRLAEDPSTATGAAEEILRLAAPSDLGLVRYAHDDVTLGHPGEPRLTLARGDAVIVSISAANRDPAAFPDPSRFDPDRSPNHHLAFGHGAHFCIGQALARIELRAVFSQLYRRLPTLRLAIDPAGLQLRRDQFTGGIDALPVCW